MATFKKGDKVRLKSHECGRDDNYHPPAFAGKVLTVDYTAGSVSGGNTYTKEYAHCIFGNCLELAPDLPLAVGTKVSIARERGNLSGWSPLWDVTTGYIGEIATSRRNRPYTVYQESATDTQGYLGLFGDKELTALPDEAPAPEEARGAIATAQNTKVGDVLEVVKTFECPLKVGARVTITSITNDGWIRYDSPRHSCNTDLHANFRHVLKDVEPSGETMVARKRFPKGFTTLVDETTITKGTTMPNNPFSVGDRAIVHDSGCDANGKEVVVTRISGNTVYYELPDGFHDCYTLYKLLELTTKKESFMSNLINKARELALSPIERLRRKYGIHDTNGARTTRSDTGYVYDDMLMELLRDKFSDDIDAKLEAVAAEEAKEAKKSK